MNKEIIDKESWQKEGVETTLNFTTEGGMLDIIVQVTEHGKLIDMLRYTFTKKLLQQIVDNEQRTDNQTNESSTAS